MNSRASKAMRTDRRSEPVQSRAPDPEAQAADHQVQVALAAYFIAEKRGFEPGHELDDWLAAEAQVASAEQPSITKPLLPVKAESIS
jgi:DUF2934 family protein